MMYINFKNIPLMLKIKYLANPLYSENFAVGYASRELIESMIPVSEELVNYSYAVSQIYRNILKNEQIFIENIDNRIRQLLIDGLDNILNYEIHYLEDPLKEECHCLMNQLFKN